MQFSIQNLEISSFKKPHPILLLRGEGILRGMERRIGNILIALSLLGFVYTFSPLLQIYLFPPPLAKSLPSKGTYITISKIHAQAPVFEGVDPWHEASYRAILEKGVALAKGTALPGQSGTMYIFAHSSAPPWELTRYNSIFLRLPELKAGDTITIEHNGKVYTYKVRESKEVWPNDVAYLLQTKRTQLILQTCTPIGTSLMRLLVFADPQ